MGGNNRLNDTTQIIFQNFASTTLKNGAFRTLYLNKVSSKSDSARIIQNHAYQAIHLSDSLKKEKR